MPIQTAETDQNALLERIGSRAQEGSGATPDPHNPDQVIRWALKRFEGWRSVATSGLGMEGCVLLDLLAKAGATLDVFFIDTGFLFPETLALLDELA